MARRSARSGTCCAGQDIYDAQDGRRPARHRPLCVRLRKPLPRQRDRALRRRICARAHADPLHPLQPGREVHRPARLRPRSRRRLPRHRPLCPPRRAGAHGAELHRAADPARDQSYFLFAHDRATSSIILRFPLGDLPKTRGARDRARSWGWRSPTSPTARTSASSPTAIMPRLVKKAAARSGGAGRDRRPATGACSARIAGLIHFTVGQRRGLEIGGQPEPLYVLRLEPETRRRGGRPEARAGGARGAARAASTGSARTSARR